MGFFDSHDDVPERWRDLMDRPLPSAAEEAALFIRLRAGDEAAKRLLVEGYTRLVVNVAKTYRGQGARRGLTLGDLIQAGSDGLARATERFDLDKGYRFSTYATHWVRHFIGQAIADRSGLPRLSTHLSKFLVNVDETRARLTRESGREPTLEETAAALGIEPEALRLFLEGDHGLGSA